MDDVERGGGNPVFCVTEEQFLTIEPGEVKVTLDLMLDEFEREMTNFTELAQNRTVSVATLQLLAYLYSCDQD